MSFDELDFLSLLAYTDLQLGRFSQAAEASKSALEIAIRTIDTEKQRLALRQLGLACLEMGQVEEAKKAAEQIRQLAERTSFPKSLRHYEHLMGWIALKGGRPDEAVRHFERAVSLLPSQMEITDEQAFYYDGLAAAWSGSGDWPKAIETYKAIISLTTGRLQWGDIYVRSHYRLGKCYQRGGKTAEAGACYRSFLKLWADADGGLPDVADAKKELETLGRVP